MNPFARGLVLLAIAAMMAPGSVQAQTIPSVRITFPDNYQPPGNPMRVIVEVNSTYQLQPVKGTLHGKEFTLARIRSEGTRAWFDAYVDVTDVPYGWLPLTVRVMDVLGHGAEATKDVRVDKPPRIEVLKPQWGELVERCARFEVVCVDDGPGCTRLQGLGALGTSRLDILYSEPVFENRPADITFTATDSTYFLFQTIKLVTAPDGMLKTLRRVDWAVWDVDATRILSGNGRAIRLTARDTGQDSVRTDLASNVSHAVLTPDGFLVARGQELELWREGQFTSLPPLKRGLPSVAGRYAAWVSEVTGQKEVVRLDTLTGELTHVLPLSDQEPDQPAVGDNGVVVFKDGTWLTVHDANGTHKLFEPPDATLAPSSPITDGVRFIYTTQNPPGVFLREDSTETRLADDAVRPVTQYRILNGTVAFERNMDGTIQVFRMRLGEEPQQLTFYSRSSMLSGLAKNGNVTTTGLDYTLLNRPDGTSSPLYRASDAREFVGKDGELYVAAGGHVHAVVDQPGTAQSCEPGTGNDAGVDAGVDAGADAGVDAGVDAGEDAGVDAGVDAGEDAGVDAGEDAGAGKPEVDLKSSSCAAAPGSAWMGLLVLGGLAIRRRRLSPRGAPADGGPRCPE